MRNRTHTLGQAMVMALQSFAKGNSHAAAPAAALLSDSCALLREHLQHLTQAQKEVAQTQNEGR